MEPGTGKNAGLENGNRSEVLFSNLETANTKEVWLSG